MSKTSERLREHDARIGSPVAFEAANLLDEAEKALAPVGEMAMWTESAEDNEMVIMTAGTIRKMRATLARIRGEK